MNSETWFQLYLWMMTNLERHWNQFKTDRNWAVRLSGQNNGRVDLSQIHVKSADRKKKYRTCPSPVMVLKEPKLAKSQISNKEQQSAKPNKAHTVHTQNSKITTGGVDHILRSHKILQMMKS